MLVAVHQFAHVDGLFQAKLFGHLLEPLAHLLSPLVGVGGRGFGRDPAPRPAQLTDLGEKPVLRLGGQVHQQPFGQPSGWCRRVKAGAAQRGGPILP